MAVKLVQLAQLKPAKLNSSSLRPAPLTEVTLEEGVNRLSLQPRLLNGRTYPLESLLRSSFERIPGIGGGA